MIKHGFDTTHISINATGQFFKTTTTTVKQQNKVQLYFDAKTIYCILRKKS